MEYFPAAKMEEIAEGQTKLIHHENGDIVLFNVDGRLFCCSNLCPHQHRSELHRGTLRGAEITCPVHGWAFSLETGIGAQGGKLNMLKVYEEDGWVWAEKPKNKFLF